MTREVVTVYVSEFFQVMADPAAIEQLTIIQPKEPAKLIAPVKKSVLNTTTELLRVMVHVLNGILYIKWDRKKSFQTGIKSLLFIFSEATRRLAKQSKQFCVT